LEIPTNRDMRAVWGRGPTEIYFAGDSGAMLRYDGAAWRTLSAPNVPLPFGLYGIPGTNTLVISGERGRVIEGN
jgi:hypothetical protein